MARWGRAARELQLPAGSRVLDLGCAFGFGTRALTRRFEAYGHDMSEAYVARARRTVMEASFTQGPADRVPYQDGFFDAVVLLDVLEHVPDEEAVVAEVGRVLRADGRLVLTVPNRGLLARLDSLNVYERLTGGKAAAPTDDPSWSGVRKHRHYTLPEIEHLLGEEFVVRSVEYTGLGLAEVVNLPLLLAFRRWNRLHRIYDVVQYLYFAVYLLEDNLRTGPWGYHMLVTADRR